MRSHTVSITIRTTDKSSNYYYSACTNWGKKKITTELSTFIQHQRLRRLIQILKALKIQIRELLKIVIQVHFKIKIKIIISKTSKHQIKVYF